MKSVAIEIKKLLLDEGLTQTELAERLGTSKANVGAQLTRNAFRTTDIERIADALGYNVEIVFKKR